MLVAKSKGADTVAVMSVYANTGQTFYWLKSYGVNGVKDFAGHKIGNPPGDASRVMWPAFAKAAGLAPDAVGFVNVGPTAKIAALKSHTVDIISDFYNEHDLKVIEFGGDLGFVNWKDMLELTSVKSSLSRAETALLADSLCNLIALAAAEGMPTKRLKPELQMEALLAYCRQHLHDADLTPQRAADHLGISVRTLHSRFRQTGQTFSRWLLDNRLEGCSVALRDPNQRALNISDVAYRWGFNDLSHFNKAFRSRFDLTPGEWRHIADA